MNSLASRANLPERVLLGAWCAAIFANLARAGVRDVVISPGSRNTPLTLAALHTQELRCHSVIDERSAGFFALGMAKGARRPVALLCTSGTAGAHYYPALIEASYADVPLVVITADRPSELQDCGAPQTIRQQGLFGTFVRAEAQADDPKSEEPTFERLGSTVFDLVLHSQTPRPGPVHLNVPLRKPLEPELPGGTEQTERYMSLFFAARGAPSLIPEVPQGRAAESQDSEDLRSTWRAALTSADRPLVVAGPLSPEEHRLVQNLAEQWGVPFLSEYSRAPHLSGLEFYPQLLRGSDLPDCIFHFGPPCVSSAWVRFVDSFEGRYFVACGTAFREPSGRAERVWVSGIDSTVLTLRTPPQAPSRSGWTTRLVDIQTQIDAAALKSLRSIENQVNSQSEPGAVFALLGALPQDTELVLANSLALRLASWVWGTSGASLPPHTFRGVNGIDGTVAASAGIGASKQKPTALLIGDVALAHDVGSLALLRSLEQPFVLLLLDNGGGRLFDHLPAKSRVPDSEFSSLTTRPNVDFELVFRAYGLSYFRAEQIEHIAPAVEQALSQSTPSAIHMVVDPTTTLQFLTHMRKALGQ
jgi:2-succinyl-5-enolpyruvyl-6-hydroxy-3-cyclohexene-1-carboxylate synthase